MDDNEQFEGSGDDREWDLESAELAYTIISRYVEHAQISGMVIAILAQHVGEERLKPLVQSEYWQSFQASRRALAEAQKEIEELTAIIDRKRALRDRAPDE